MLLICQDSAVFFCVCVCECGVFVVAVVVVIQLIVTLWEFWAPSVAV